MSSYTEQLKNKLNKILSANNQKEESQIRELISMESQHLVSFNQGPTTLIELLVELKAPHLASLAAECHYHATLQQHKEATGKNLASVSPIFSINNRTLCAVPVGDLQNKECSIFFDRVLAAILRKRPKKVLLVETGLTINETTKKALREFESDLKSQGILLQKISQN